MSVTRVLVANRGEIAVRVIRACQSLGIETVAAVSDADRESMAAQMANRAVCIGPARSTDSYLKIENLMAAAQGTGCDWRRSRGRAGNNLRKWYQTGSATHWDGQPSHPDSWPGQ